MSFPMRLAAVAVLTAATAAAITAVNTSTAVSDRPAVVAINPKDPPPEITKG
jgi:hypothetical protein